jgi:hypothetical protein
MTITAGEAGVEHARSLRFLIHHTLGKDIQ